MTYRFWLKLAAIATAVALLAAAFQAWRADRRDRAHLAAELAATKQLLVAADARQRNRDAQLSQTLSALDAQKRAILTPAQIVSELQKNIPLPAPLTLQDDHVSLPHVEARFSSPRDTKGASPTSSTPQEEATLGSPPPNATATTILHGGLKKQAATGSAPTETSSPRSASIPRADLKPLYDFTLDCQACQAKLSIAQSDLADEKAKTAALTKERDDAIRVAKGGSAWRRFARAAKWLAIGAAVGAIASKTAHYA